jgi:hypothetical protein
MTNMRNNQQLVNEVGAWAAKNFPASDPWMGMVEELGEATHALLKRKQGIRGYDNPIFFKEEFADALGDFTIFAAHWFYLHQNAKVMDYALEVPRTKWPEDANTVISRIMAALANVQQGNEYQMANVSF